MLLPLLRLLHRGHVVPVTWRVTRRDVHTSWMMTSVVGDGRRSIEDMTTKDYYCHQNRQYSSNIGWMVPLHGDEFCVILCLLSLLLLLFLSYVSYCALVNVSSSWRSVWKRSRIRDIAEGYRYIRLWCNKQFRFGYWDGVRTGSDASPLKTWWTL